MKLRVNRYLNIRTDRPQILPNNNTGDLYLVPGEEVEVVETVVGDTYKGNNIWFKLSDGSFVWSGGVGSVDQHRETSVNNWVDLFGLTAITSTLQEQIENLSICILDTGIDENHPDLRGVKIEGENFVNKNLDTLDKDGHGSFCAGILAGNGTSKISGVLKGARLRVGKILISSEPGLGGLKSETLINAIEWGAKHSDIISISAGITTYDSKLESVINVLANAGKIVVAATGNAVHTNNSLPNYPAKFSTCISVASVDNAFKFSTFNIKNSRIDICFPGEHILSTHLSNARSYMTMSGTSTSTPFIAAIAAIIKLKNPDFDVDRVRQVLRTISEEKQTDGFIYRSIINKPLQL